MSGFPAVNNSLLVFYNLFLTAFDNSSVTLFQKQTFHINFALWNLTDDFQREPQFNTPNFFLTNLIAFFLQFGIFMCFH